MRPEAELHIRPAGVQLSCLLRPCAVPPLTHVCALLCVVEQTRDLLRAGRRNVLVLRDARARIPELLRMVLLIDKVGVW